MENERYNPSLLMPIIDVIVGIVLLAGAGFLWYNTRGQEQVMVAREQLEQIRQEQRTELVAKGLEIDDLGEQLVDVRNDHEAKKQYVAFLEQRIDVETTTIEEGKEKDRRYTDVLLELRDDIRLATDELRGNEGGIAEEEDRIARRQSEIDSLQAEVLARERRISELENETAEALAIRRHDPFSIFPTRAGFLAAYEVNDVTTRFVAGLSHDLFSLQNLRLGLQGVVGLSSDENSSLKEGGVYLNIPLIFRRASIEVGAGVSGTRQGALSTEYDPYLSGHFRLAPIRKERLFLLGGPHLTSETVGFRVGLGIGRR